MGADDDRLKILERRVEKAWEKLDGLVELAVQLREANKYQVERMVAMENGFLQHMQNEEVQLALMNSEIVGLTRFKYVALSVLATVLIITNPNVATAVIKILQ